MREKPAYRTPSPLLRAARTERYRQALAAATEGMNVLRFTPTLGGHEEQVARNGTLRVPTEPSVEPRAAPVSVPIGTVATAPEPVDLALVEAFDEHPDADIALVPIAAWRALVNILGHSARRVQLNPDVQAIELDTHPCGGCYVAWDGQR